MPTARPAVARRTPPMIQALEPRQLMSVAPAAAVVPTTRPVGPALVYARTAAPAAATTASLTLSVAHSKVPENVVLGRPAGGTVTVTVNNTSQTAATGTYTVAVYATTTGAIDTATSTVVGTLKRHLTVRGGKSATVTVGVKSFPQVAGAYTLLPRLTDADGVTADASTGPAVTIAAANVALAAAVLSPVPAVVVAGQAFAVGVDLANTGNVAATGVATLTLSLSTNGTVTNYTLATVKRQLRLPAGGKAARLTFRLRVPATAATGGYLTALTVTQGTATVTAAGTSALAVTAVVPAPR